MKTTSYEISKKLAEIGFEGDAINYYRIGESDTVWHLLELQFEGIDNHYPAYDLETILEALRKVKWFNCRITKSDVNFGYCEIYRDKNKELQERTFSVSNLNDESLADTAARLLILLHEKGIVKFNN